MEDNEGFQSNRPILQYTVPGLSGKNVLATAYNIIAVLTAGLEITTVLRRTLFAVLNKTLFKNYPLKEPKSCGALAPLTQDSQISPSLAYIDTIQTQNEICTAQFMCHYCTIYSAVSPVSKLGTALNTTYFRRGGCVDLYTLVSETTKKIDTKVLFYFGSQNV